MKRDHTFIVCVVAAWLLIVALFVLLTVKARAQIAPGALHRLTGNSTSSDVTIIITNVPEGLTNYAIPLTINSNYISNFSADGDSLRVYDSDGTTLLNHWIERWDSSLNQSAVVWVKIPLLLTGIVHNVYLRNVAGGADASSATNTFTLGYDFLDGVTTGLTLNATNNGSIGLESTTNWYGINVSGWERSLPIPVITNGTGGAWDTLVARDLNILVDESGNIVREGGLLVGYYTGAASTATYQGGRVTSPDGVYWTKNGSNPLLTTNSIAGSFDQSHTRPGSFIKRSSGYYLLYYAGKDTNGFSQLGFATSTDGTNWTRYASNPILATNNLSTNVVSLSVPSVQKLMDGSWLMTFEAGTLNWGIYGATSADGTNWVVMNSGNPILAPSSGWESTDVANPKIYEAGTSNYVLFYNGKGSGFAVGVAYSTNLLNWTKLGSNPTFIQSADSGTWEDYGLEMDAIYNQQFKNFRRIAKLFYHGWNSATGIQAGMATIYQGTRLFGNGGSATNNGWNVGFLVTPTNKFEIRSSVAGGQWPSDTSLIQVPVILDSASVPAIIPNTTFNAMSRVAILRAPWGRTGSWGSGNFNGGLCFNYKTVADVNQYWNGSTWQAGNYFFGYHGRVITSIADDGVNYLFNAYDENGTPLIAQASIAKTSVKAFSSGKAVIWGEPYINFYYGSQYIEYLLMRQFTTNQPSVLFQ